MFHYHAFGLGLESEAPIEFASPADVESPDARVRFGDLSALRDRHHLHSEDRRFLMDDGAAILHWSSVGTMAVRGGKEIVIDQFDGVDASLLSMAVSGPPLGILLHQRGDLVLHASGVVIDGGIAAFVGHKGFGKSTTAAALHQAGYDLFTDDILSVHMNGTVPSAHPGFSQLKLWPSAAEVIFPDGDDQHEPVGIDKQVWSVQTAYQGEPLPVNSIFALEMGDLGVKRMGGQSGLMEVLRNSYASRFVGTEGTPPDHFRRCAEFVKRVPVYHLERKPGLEALPEIARIVVETVRGGSGAQS